MQSTEYYFTFDSETQRAHPKTEGITNRDGYGLGLGMVLYFLNPICQFFGNMDPTQTQTRNGVYSCDHNPPRLFGLKSI